MEPNFKESFLNSLDLPNQELEKYIPKLLHGLWELGSIPQYTLELLKRNALLEKNIKITDFGCGKGAVLILLAKEIPINGTGIDIGPEFIEEAKSFARINNISGIQFKIGDIAKEINFVENQDIVIFGYDSDILGDLKSSLNQLKNTIHSNGKLILEFMYAPDSSENKNGEINLSEMLHQIGESQMEIVDQIIWETSMLKEVNKKNNVQIKQNLDRLKMLYPDKAVLFDHYYQNQLKECAYLENDVKCCTLLMQKKANIPIGS